MLKTPLSFSLQILSGENAAAYELMMLSEMESMRRSAQGSGAVGIAGFSSGGVGGLDGFGVAGGDIGGSRKAKKFTSQQHLFRQLDRKYKKLVSEMEQLQTKHRAEMKEVALLITLQFALKHPLLCCDHKVTSRRFKPPLVKFQRFLRVRRNACQLLRTHNLAHNKRIMMPATKLEESMFVYTDAHTFLLFPVTSSIFGQGRDAVLLARTHTVRAYVCAWMCVCACARTCDPTVRAHCQHACVFVPLLIMRHRASAGQPASQLAAAYVTPESMPFHPPRDSSCERVVLLPGLSTWPWDSTRTKRCALLLEG